MEIKLIDLITKNRDIFFHFINICNDTYRSGHDLNSYRQIIRRHEETKHLQTLIEDDNFCSLIYETLKAFNMNQRGAKLKQIDSLKTSLRSLKPELMSLSQYQLHSLHSSQIRDFINDSLKKVFKELDVMKSQRRIVGVSKTLHFVLPNLLMPIDSKYTMPFFYGENKYSKNIDKEFETYQDIFSKTHRIVRGLCLTQQDVNGQQWNTSIPKLIDNAIIGCYKSIEDNSVDDLVSVMKDKASLSHLELNQYIHLIRKLKKKIVDALREKIRQKLIIKKAIEAGIEVTEEEVAAEIRRIKGSE